VSGISINDFKVKQRGREGGRKKRRGRNGNRTNK
jgi:hypothetical protein